jgi:molecular chaperone GrpE (heat shock protein)
VKASQPTVVTTSEADDYLFYKEKIRMLAEKICGEFNRLGFEDRGLFDEVAAAVEAHWSEKEEENERVEEEQKMEEMKKETIPELKSKMEDLRAQINQKVQDITNLKVIQ